MRFQIEWTPKSDDALLQIRCAEKVIPVTSVDGYAGYAGTGWTWIDRSVCTLVCPLFPFPAGQTPQWYVFSNEHKRLTGKLRDLPWHKQILRASTELEWDLDGRTVVEESIGCCRKELRFRGGRRLAPLTREPTSRLPRRRAPNA